MEPGPRHTAGKSAKESAEINLQTSGDNNKPNESLKTANETLTVPSTEIMSGGEAIRTTKAERNKRKKESAKRRKSDAKRKQQEETRLLDEMRALAITDQQEGNARARLTKDEADDRSESMEDIQVQATGAVTLSVHDKNIPDPPPGALFTFKACPEDKGVGAFAKEFIKEGTEILVEEAVTRGDDDWKCKEALFKVLSTEKQDKIMALHSRCTCKSTPCRETPLMKIWDVNAFKTGASAVLFVVASRFNHDCLPNIARGFSKEDHMVFRAARDIQEGEELTIHYIMSPGSSQDRRRKLLEHFGFVCRCKGCKSDRRIYTASDFDSMTLPRGVETHSPVLGKFSDAEIAAQAEVKAWLEQINAGLNMMQGTLYESLRERAMVGHSSVADSKSRGVIVGDLMAAIERFLRGNNQFGLDDVFFECYMARNTRSMIEATERTFVFILEDLEEQKQKDGVSG